MHDLFQIVYNALPEALGGLMIILLGFLYKKFSNIRAIKKQTVIKVGKLGNLPKNKKDIRVIVESVHTGESYELWVSPQASIGFLAEKAQFYLGADTIIKICSNVSFIIKWVLVDANAEKRWRKLKRSEQRELRSLIKTKKGLKKSCNDLDKLDDIGIYEGIIFHLHAVEDEYSMTALARTARDVNSLRTDNQMLETTSSLYYQTYYSITLKGVVIYISKWLLFIARWLIFIIIIFPIRLLILGFAWFKFHLQSFKMSIVQSNIVQKAIRAIFWKVGPICSTCKKSTLLIPQKSFAKLLFQSGIPFEVRLIANKAAQYCSSCSQMFCFRCVFEFEEKIRLGKIVCPQCSATTLVFNEHKKT